MYTHSRYHCLHLSQPTVATTVSKNMTEICANITEMESLNTTIDWVSLSANACRQHGGDAIGDGCDTPFYVADVFFLSVLLFLGTFGVAVTLKDFKMTSIFPTAVRQLVSDFAVLLSIIIFVLIDMGLGVNTPKLMVPDKFQVRDYNYTTNSCIRCILHT